MQNEETKEIRYIDLFGGVGGFRLGIERATNGEGIRQSKGINRSRSQNLQGKRNKSINKGNNPKFNCVWYNDIDKYAVQTYNKNFKENWKATDIRTIKTSEIPDFDLFCAGFPCQAFSIAGKRKGFEDTRGTLFYEIARILKAKGPKYFLLENVKGLLSHDRGKTFAIIISTLTELGYDVQWMVFNSKFFGVPQNRERVFIIGSLGEESRPEILPFRESSKEINQQKSRVSFPTVFASQHKIARGMPMISSIQGDVSGKGYKSQQDRVHLTKGIMACLPSSRTEDKIKILLQNMKIRRLTPIECERLQGFPDNWTEGVSDTQRYKQMGNAVTVNVIQAIISKLLVPKDKMTVGTKDA